VYDYNDDESDVVGNSPSQSPSTWRLLGILQSEYAIWEFPGWGVRH